MNQPGAQNRPVNTAGGSGIAQGWPLPTRGARSRATRQVNAQAGPSSQPAQPAVTQNEYPTPPPTYSSPAPAPDPALPAAPATQQSPASILERIGQQLADNHDELIEHLDENFDLVIQHLEDLNGTMRQIRDTNLDTLSESFHSADEEVFAFDAGVPPAPTADPDVLAGNAIPMHPEPPTSLELYGSMYASTEIETPRESAPLGRTPMIAVANSNLPPTAAGHARQPLDPQPSVELGEEGRAPRERTLRRRHAFRSLSLPVDEESNVAAGTGENASTSLDANRIFSRPASTVGVYAGKATGGQGPAEPLEVPSPATDSDAASLEGFAFEAPNIQSHAGTDEDSNAVLTLVGCRPITEQACPGTLQLIIDVGTNGEVDKCEQLFFLGDFNEATDRLPGICAKRKLQWFELYLRIREPVSQGSDTMLAVMDCLRPYLRYFLAVHFVVDKESEAIGAELTSFDADFSRLLSLSVKGELTWHRLMFFPLVNLRYLNIESNMNPAEIMDIIDRSKLLEVFQLDLPNASGSPGCAGDVEVILQEPTQFPPTMFIRADNPAVLIPHLLAAESTTTDLRLRADVHTCTPELRALFQRHATWFLMS